jgi:hypothetical protein
LNDLTKLVTAGDPEEPRSNHEPPLFESVQANGTEFHEATTVLTLNFNMPIEDLSSLYWRRGCP